MVHFTSIDAIGGIIFKPEIFHIFLGAISGLSLLAILTYIIQSKKQARLQADEKMRARQHWERQLKEYANKNNELTKAISLQRAQIDSMEQEIASLKGLKEELNKKDEYLRNETLAREKIQAGLKDAGSQIALLKKTLDSREGQLNDAGRIKEELGRMEQELRRREEELKSAQGELAGVRDKLKSAQEVYNGLREQYAELELQLDVINQSFALEKTLHSRLKEEHAQCQKPAPQ